MLRRGFKILFIFIVAWLALGTSAFGFVAQSLHYRLEKDSLNFGGNDFSTSSAYQLSDTLGEVGTGNSADLVAAVRAGYRAAENYSLSITSPGNVAMAPVIDGTIGGTSNGSANWTVMTDNPAGYTLALSADASPALVSGVNNFSDYVPIVVGTPDYNWSIAAAASAFGFTPEGGDILNKFRDNGAACNIVAGNDTASQCWTGLSVAGEIIAQTAAGNLPAGTITTVRFRADVGANKTQQQGNYVANITATALAI